MKNIFLLAVILLNTLACSHSGQLTNKSINNGAYNKEKEPSNTPTNNAISLKMYENGDLAITLPHPHPSGFSIKAPNGKWFVLQDTESGIYLLPEPEFNTSSTLTLNIATLKGVTWENGVKKTSKVFSHPGNYLLYFANNLETEPENTFSMSVVFKHK